MSILGGSKQNVSFGDDDNRSIVFRHSQGVANCCVDTVLYLHLLSSASSRCSFCWFSV